MSSSTDDAACVEEATLTPELSAFISAVAVVIGWAIFAAALYFCFLQERLDGAPALAAQFFAVSGVLQLSATVVLMVVFVPQCGDCCPFHTRQWQYYGGSSLLSIIGFVWLFMAWNRSNLAHQLSGGELGGGTDGGIFSKIPSDAFEDDAEVELTEHSDSTVDDEEL